MNNPLADAKVKMPMAEETMAPEAPAAQAPAPATTLQLPEPLGAVARKEIPGVIVPPLVPGQQPDPVQLFVVSNFDVLPTVAPIDYFDTQAKETVVFNSELLTAEQLEQAEKDGTLKNLVQSANGGTAAAAPGMSAEGTSIPAPQPATPTMRAPKPSAGMQDMLANARIKNLQGGPRVSPIQPNPVSQQMARRTL